GPPEMEVFVAAEFHGGTETRRAEERDGGGESHGSPDRGRPRPPTDGGGGDPRPRRGEQGGGDQGSDPKQERRGEKPVGARDVLDPERHAGDRDHATGAEAYAFPGPMAEKAGHHRHHRHLGPSPRKEDEGDREQHDRAARVTLHASPTRAVSGAPRVGRDWAPAPASRARNGTTGTRNRVFASGPAGTRLK